MLSGRIPAMTAESAAAATLAIAAVNEAQNIAIALLQYPRYPTSTPSPSDWIRSIYRHRVCVEFFWFTRSELRQILPHLSLIKLSIEIDARHHLRRHFVYFYPGSLAISSWQMICDFSERAGHGSQWCDQTLGYQICREVGMGFSASNIS